MVSIAVTSQREGIALLDKAGETLYVGPNNDLRGAFQGASIDDSHAAAIWRSSGHLPSFMLAWSKLAWFRDESPDVYRRIAHVTSLADWLVYELTGELRLERSLGVEAGLVELASGGAANELAVRLGFDGITPPGLVNAGCVVGAVLSQAARSLSVPAGTSVVIAGPDTQTALVGLGIATAGEAGVIAGWSGTVQRVTASPVWDPERGLWSGRHVVADRYVLEGNTGVMGGAYDWLSRMVSGRNSPETGYKAIDRAALKRSRGAGSTSAHLGPDLQNLSAASLRTGGILFPVPLALEPPDAGLLGRAAIENFAFSIRANLDRLDTVLASPAQKVAVGGGMVRSATFRRVLADVTDRLVHVGSPDASLMGAITLAAAATHQGPALDDGVARRARSCREVAPDQIGAEEYDGLYHQWRRRGDVLRQIGL